MQQHICIARFFPERLMNSKSQNGMKRFELCNSDLNVSELIEAGKIRHWGRSGLSC